MFRHEPGCRHESLTRLGGCLRGEGWHASHWSQLGDPRAPDESIVEWARDHRAVILTQNLGFGAMLAMTRAQSPSIALLRMTGSTLPEHAKGVVVPAIRAVSDSLEEGTILVVGDAGHRVRVLPFGDPD